MQLTNFIDDGLISKIDDFEIDRYIKFFESSYKDDIEHTKANIEIFPRWAIISGYYAMHDITKLFLAKKFQIKIENKVHQTTILVLEEIIEDKDIIKLIVDAYEDFVNISNELKSSKRKRVKAQYYTGTPYSKEIFKKMAKEFLENNVVKYIKKIEVLIEK